MFRIAANTPRCGPTLAKLHDINAFEAERQDESGIQAIELVVQFRPI
jgi:hypothetical protein